MQLSLIYFYNGYFFGIQKRTAMPNRCELLIICSYILLKIIKYINLKQGNLILCLFQIKHV